MCIYYVTCIPPFLRELFTTYSHNTKVSNIIYVDTIRYAFPVWVVIIYYINNNIRVCVYTYTRSRRDMFGKRCMFVQDGLRVHCYIFACFLRLLHTTHMCCTRDQYFMHCFIYVVS